MQMIVQLENRVDLNGHSWNCQCQTRLRRRVRGGMRSATISSIRHKLIFQDYTRKILFFSVVNGRFFAQKAFHLRVSFIVSVPNRAEEVVGVFIIMRFLAAAGVR